MSYSTSPLQPPTLNAFSICFISADRPPLAVLPAEAAQVAEGQARPHRRIRRIKGEEEEIRDLRVWT